MNRKFTSDWHLGHHNVITYCNRPFISKEEMNEYIINHAKETLSKDKTDELYILGDVSFNPKYALELPKLLDPCKLILISGNHDKTFPYKNKSTKMINKYIDHGWKDVKLYEELQLKDGRNILLSHLPYSTGDNLKYDDRYLEWRPKDEGKVLLSGHVHGRYKKNGRVIDVGLDAHALKILSEDDVINLINDPREFIPSELTEWYKERDGKKE